MNGGRSPRGERWPDFFVVGQAKSGTTALAEMLDQHKRLFMPAIKEPGYFANELFAPEHAARAISESDYLALFDSAGPDQVVGESSTQYIYSTEAARRIAAVRPDAKIIVFFRDPAAFIISMHRQLVQNRYESEPDLGRALDIEGDRAQGRRIPRMALRPGGLLYRRRARYVEQLTRYEREFAHDQILVLIYEDFRADNSAILGQIFDFLGVPGGVTIDPRRANPSVQIRSTTAHRALYALSAIRASPAARPANTLVKSIPEGTRRRAVAFARDRLREPTREPDPALIAGLRAKLRPEVEALSEHLGRDLVSLWGY